MNAVVSAIETGRCSVAVSGSLLRDAEVMLALTERAALAPMALSGPAISPVIDVSDRGVARSISAPGGVLVLVEPEVQDQAGVGDLVKLLGRSGNKPKVVVVARNFNPFAFPALLGLKVEHHKDRGKAFLKALPVPPADQAPVETPVAKASSAKSGDLGAPKYAFVGREDELAALGGMLAQGGPIVVSGPHGVGKRTLVDHAIAASGLTRLPDLQLGRGTGFDTLVARLAVICDKAGAPGLLDVASRPDAKPTEIVQAAVDALAAAQTDQVMVVAGLHTALGRQRDFFRKSRLELLLIALLTHTYGLRLVFLSVEPPLIYREGATAHLRQLELGGVKGRFLHEIFEAYKAPEFPRERFGPIAEKIHGHPMAARAYAIEVRERPEGVGLTEDAKFMKMESLAALDPLRKRIEKRIEKLAEEDRAALATIAHLLVPAPIEVLNDLGVKRKARLHLLAQGLLEMVGTDAERLFRVHPLVRSQLTFRETSDFDTFRKIAELWWGKRKDASGVQLLALDQEFNRAVIGCRDLRNRVPTPLPDNDHLVESCVGMIRSRKPNLQLARQRLAELIKAHPGNADAHLLRLELVATEERASREPRRGREDDAEVSGDAREFTAFAEEAMASAPVPEVFHRVAGYWLGRRARHKAIEVLERAVAALPDEARLRCRLGALLLRHGRRNEAIQTLQEAMALEPMLPDAYGLLGMAKRDEGAAALPEAEELLREAVRLAPADPVQTARLADLLMHHAATLTEPDARAARYAEAKELLETSLRGDEEAAESQLLLAQLHRESGGDLERAAWFLKQAKKNSERGAERLNRIALERALIHAARGEHDDAEALARDQAARNPSSHRAFATLASVLETRQQLIPAHAEYLRAKERAPQGSVWANTYDAEITRLQALIEAVAAGLVQLPEPPASKPAFDESRAEATGNTAHRTIRRRSREASDGGQAPSEDPPASDEAAVDASGEPSSEPGGFGGEAFTPSEEPPAAG